MTAWTAGLVVGLPFTGVQWFSGPFADSPIGRHGPGRAATTVASAAPYAILPRPAARGSGSEPRGDVPLHF
ncbi:hypothetical protein ACFCZT_27060 [Streptomyces sp. NPDC056230]|uniref:hypothetical protein n=1 Tax=Streptomyces sp. NPDC056230 TaxID=3345754 RepID=UPI0035DEAE6E